MHYTKFKFESFVTRSRNVLKVGNTTSHLKEAVKEFGYNDERISEGYKLYDSLVDIAFKQAKHEVDKKKRFGEKAKHHTQVAIDYMKYLKIARIVFDKDEEAIVALMLKGGRERTYEKWYYQVSVFCNNLLATPAFIERMKEFGVNRSSLKKLKADLDQLQQLSEECTRLTAELRKLVREKKQRTIIWQEWLSDYIKIIRIAVQGTSLEQHGWLKRLLMHG